MKKRHKNIFRVLPAAVTAMMLLFMTAAGAWAEGTREPPTLLQIDNAETTGKQWAEMLGLSEPLKSVEVNQRYDSFIDLINNYQPDFMGVFTYQDETPKHSTNPGSSRPSPLRMPCWRKSRPCRL